MAEGKLTQYLMEVGGYNRNEARKINRLVREAILTICKAGDILTIEGLGSFRKTYREGRTYRDMRTGQTRTSQGFYTIRLQISREARRFLNSP